MVCYPKNLKFHNLFYVYDTLDFLGGSGKLVKQEAAAGSWESRNGESQRATMRSGGHRGNGITVPICESERLQESRPKVSELTEG
jgi:hypothetical protein